MNKPHMRSNREYGSCSATKNALEMTLPLAKTYRIVAEDLVPPDSKAFRERWFNEPRLAPPRITSFFDAFRASSLRFTCSKYGMNSSRVILLSLAFASAFANSSPTIFSIRS